ncbi:MAG: hypothetical protein JO362_14355 [Streptomycetaceae bacterium]|nr:hypothetical protein [Streptomycetaceae bacterium]
MPRTTTRRRARWLLAAVAFASYRPAGPAIAGTAAWSPPIRSAPHRSRLHQPETEPSRRRWRDNPAGSHPRRHASVGRNSLQEETTWPS